MKSQVNSFPQKHVLEGEIFNPHSLFILYLLFLFLPLNRIHMLRFYKYTHKALSKSTQTFIKSTKQIHLSSTQLLPQNIQQKRYAHVHTKKALDSNSRSSDGVLAFTPAEIDPSIQPILGISFAFLLLMSGYRWLFWGYLQEWFHPQRDLTTRRRLWRSIFMIHLPSSLSIP